VCITDHANNGDSHESNRRPLATHRRIQGHGAFENSDWRFVRLYLACFLWSEWGVSTVRTVRFYARNEPDCSKRAFEILDRLNQAFWGETWVPRVTRQGQKNLAPGGPNRCLTYPYLPKEASCTQANITRPSRNEGTPIA
jgi:hypothetical protein